MHVVTPRKGQLLIQAARARRAAWILRRWRALAKTPAVTAVFRTICLVAAPVIFVACTSPVPDVTPQPPSAVDLPVPAAGPTESPSPLQDGELGDLIARTEQLGEGVMDHAWDLHVAIRRGDNEAATAAARAATKLFSEFAAQTEDQETLDSCMREAWSTVTQAITAEQQHWLAWSEGDDLPTKDDVDVFFAFYGIPDPWSATLREAHALCSPSA